MAFKLAKASGVRIPDFVDHIPADATNLTIDDIENGILVKIVAGELEPATASADAIAGILVNEAGASRYAAPGSGVYTSTFKNTDQVTFMPVTTTLLIEADVSGTDSEFVIGKEFDMEMTGFTVVGAAAPATGDFRVTRIRYAKDGTTVTKVEGFFKNTGYFVS